MTAKSAGAAGRHGAVARTKAKEAAVGAVGRVLFYPTLLYNVVRSKLQAEFRWWDEVDQFILLGAVPFCRDVLRLQKLGVYGVITLNEPFETLVPSSMYQVVQASGSHEPFSISISIRGCGLLTAADLEGSDVTEVITEDASLSSHDTSPSRRMIKMLALLFPSLMRSGDSSLTLRYMHASPIPG